MAPYRNYDYGLRGAPRAISARFRDAPRPVGYDRASFDRPGRVTARFNRDYVDGDHGDLYPRSYFFYGGDRVGDERWYRRPPTAPEGSRPRPDDPAYGPDEDGRYPDEI